MQEPTGVRDSRQVAIVHGRGAMIDSASERAEICRGLLRSLPRIDCAYFYDDAGMQLFEEITRLPEYYQYRTEEAILTQNADEIVALTGARSLVELGSGVCRKTRLLLDAIRRRGEPESCVLLDINETFLRTSVETLAGIYPDTATRGVVGDFLQDLEAVGSGRNRLFCLLAGTIGNLDDRRLPEFLRGVRTALGKDDAFLVGLDLVKSPQRLEAAYNDGAGVTARFNLNALRVLNRRFGMDFEVDAFEHVAFYDPEREWIEMRLRAVRSTTVSLDEGRKIRFEVGQEIRTEISRKFTRKSFVAALAGTGLELSAWFTDPEGLFASAVVSPGTSTPGP